MRPFYTSNRLEDTYQIEVEVVLEYVQALHYVLVVDIAEQHDLGGKLPNEFIFHPGVFRNFVFDDELDGDLVALRAMESGQDKAVPAGAKFVFEVVCVDEFQIQLVVGRELRGIHARLSVEVDSSHTSRGVVLNGVVMVVMRGGVTRQEQVG